MFLVKCLKDPLGEIFFIRLDFGCKELLHNTQANGKYGNLHTARWGAKLNHQPVQMPPQLLRFYLCLHDLLSVFFLQGLLGLLLDKFPNQEFRLDMSNRFEL